jgi:predicted GNAT family acetyltransferase
MEVVASDDPVAFRERAGGLLLADEARHNLMLGILGTLIDRPDVYEKALMWTVEQDGHPVAAAMQTPPWNLLVSRPEKEGAIEALADRLADDGLDLPGVTGADPEGERFALHWSARREVVHRLSMAQGIYGLTSLRQVAEVSGSMRDATTGDRELLVAWMRAFSEEALPDESPVDLARMVDLRLTATEAGLVLWVDGGPVSVAGFGGRTPHGIRIGPVYTPPEHRRRGYATALVAGVSGRLLSQGRRFCFLYTDLANPTSNRIYRNIGYEPVCESRDYRFERA